ncbi:MAG: hypothetical protein PHR68_03750 [Candidatus Gracilibacteria bacterium]|nr:hypothetical protein [Candidatus Gracilibacteria bacterium]
MTYAIVPAKENLARVKQEKQIKIRDNLENFMKNCRINEIISANGKSCCSFCLKIWESYENYGASVELHMADNINIYPHSTNDFMLYYETYNLFVENMEKLGYTVIKKGSLSGGFGLVFIKIYFFQEKKFNIWNMLKNIFT